MINKKSIWFVTLFSLIIVLSVYYVTMPNELLLTNNNSQETEKVNAEESNESAELVALRVESEEEMIAEINNLKDVMTDEKTTTDEKNLAYQKMQDLNKNRGTEGKLESLISDDFKLKAFVKIKDNDISVVIDSTKHDTELANNIMRTIQKEFDNKMYITVKFQK